VSILSARRSPFPYHLKLGSTGLLLGVAKPGAPLLTSSKVQDVAQVNPPDFSYGGMSPIGDRDEPYESLVLGMGLHTQEKWQDYRYADAQCVDLSVWPWCKGPEITLLTPPSTDAAAGVRTFFELGGVLYCAQGRYVLKRVDDATWSVAKDFGAGVAILNATVFTSNFDGTPRAFFALSSGVAQWTANGTTFTPMTTFTALAFATIGREFWWATDTNLLRKCDTNADPTLEANYTTTQFRAGDKQAVITSLMVSAAGTLIIAKSDGMYTLDANGDDHQLFPFLRFGPDVNNGKAWGQFENDLYTAYGTNLYKIDPSLTIQEVGPEKLVNNDSPVRGKITAFAGVGSMFALAAIFNPDTLTGYLMKFGGWVTQQSLIATPAVPNASNFDAVHVDAWHGSLSVPFPNQAIQSLFVSKIGAPAGHTRTYLGYSDGTIGWLVNSCVPNPAACSAYRFHVGDSFVNLPIWHGGYHASLKSLRHLSVTGQRLSPTNNVTIEYKLSPGAAAFTAFPNVFDAMTYEVAPMPTDAACVQAIFRVHLHNTLDTSCPLVSAVSIGHALRPRRYMQVELVILCADGLVRRDGVPLRIGRRAIQALVEQAVDVPGAVTCTLPDESVQELSFTDYSVSQSFDEIGRQWRGSLTVKAVQWSTVLTEVA
jgi:hypothetical protein